MTEVPEIIFLCIQIDNKFCDLKKAFDCVNHDLLSKLKFYQIVGKANALVESYLHDRFQRVVINKRYTHSNWGRHQWCSPGVNLGSVRKCRF
jgi:hypothetical protein